MSQDRDLPDSPEFFNNAIPAPDYNATATAAVPRAAAREMGDYADGNYAEAQKTAEAPTMQESQFADLIQSRSP